MLLLSHAILPISVLLSNLPCPAPPPALPLPLPLPCPRPSLPQPCLPPPPASPLAPAPPPAFTPPNNASDTVSSPPTLHPPHTHRRQDCPGVLCPGWCEQVVLPGVQLPVLRILLHLHLGHHGMQKLREEVKVKPGRTALPASGGSVGAWHAWTIPS